MCRYYLRLWYECGLWWSQSLAQLNCTVSSITSKSRKHTQNTKTDNQHYICIVHHKWILYTKSIYKYTNFDFWIFLCFIRRYYFQNTNKNSFYFWSSWFGSLDGFFTNKGIWFIISLNKCFNVRGYKRFHKTLNPVCVHASSEWDRDNFKILTSFLDNNNEKMRRKGSSYWIHWISLLFQWNKF